MSLVSNILRRMHPASLLALSFALTIAVGALLLRLPFATTDGPITWVDALFTATSAVCVTGLTVVDTADTFSLVGQWILLALIQVGGLGVMTLSVTIFRLMGKSISFRQRMVMQDVFAHTPRQDIYRLLKSIFLFTGIVELAGAVLLFAHWNGTHGPARAAYLAVFHSISAFCNAGFSLFKDNLVTHGAGALPALTIGWVIVLGGIGFPVVYDIYGKLTLAAGQRRRLLVQTKTVLITTAVLIVAGMAFIWRLEATGSLASITAGQAFLACFFQSVTCRTAGFNTIDIAGLSDATLYIMIVLMFIGASPGSCGGGVKTTTFALLGALVWSRINRCVRVNIFKKSLPADTVERGIVLVLVSVFLIALVQLIMLIGGPTAAQSFAHGPFLAYLFETVSAFGTVGLSVGVTPLLSTTQKLGLVVMMFIGRVGVLTLAYLLTGGSACKGIEHAEENMMIG